MADRATTLASLVLSLALVGCARPSGVPTSASTEWDWYNTHFTYRWQRTFEAGCATWTATDRYAIVRLSIDPTDCNNGRGLEYFTVQDFIVFKSYWAWPINQPTYTFDDEGMINGVLPCPHSLSPAQIDQLRTVTQAANAEATTDAEKRTLARVDLLLSETNGAALSSAQEGCIDIPADAEPWPARREDTWSNRARPPHPDNWDLSRSDPGETPGE